MTKNTITTTQPCNERIIEGIFWVPPRRDIDITPQATKPPSHSLEASNTRGLWPLTTSPGKTPLTPGLWLNERQISIPEGKDLSSKGWDFLPSCFSAVSTNNKFILIVINNFNPFSPNTLDYAYNLKNVWVIFLFFKMKNFRLNSWKSKRYLIYYSTSWILNSHLVTVLRCCCFNDL